MSGQCLTCTRDLLPDLFKLPTDLFDLCKRRIGGGSLRFELLKLLFGLLNLALECVVLFLGDLTLLELLVSLLCRCLQRGQFFLGIFDGLSEKLLFLSDQFRIGGIQLQQLFHVLQLCLGALDILIYTLQCLGQFCGIAANLNGNALDSASHDSSLLPALDGRFTQPDLTAKKEPMDEGPSAPGFV